MVHKIAIIWLGYVGLPLAYHFAKAGDEVIWFDVSEKRLAELKAGKDSTHEIGDAISSVAITYTSDTKDLVSAEMIIVTVPTPVDENKDPDYTPLINASTAIGGVLRQGQIVVYESTVDPGATEEICLPILEKVSWLRCPEDFQIGFSPERINPGDKEHTVEKIVKVVSWCTPESLQIIATTYRRIITAGVHEAPSIKVAEASKIIENTQRDINIWFINELAKICDKLGINTFDVLAAAGTKWNFLKFTPGLVGGHCIGVDPYYLAKKAQKLGIHPELILAGRRTNDEMGMFVAHQVIKLLIKAWKKIEGAKVLIFGVTFKENVPDFRNSKIADVIKELKDFGMVVTCIDPFANYLDAHTRDELCVTEHEVLLTPPTDKYAGIVYAQDHLTFASINFDSLLEENGVFFDIKGKRRNQGFTHYKSL
jgi:UDP-N-acetyl-D-galactosamine dehydrogenase